MMLWATLLGGAAAISIKNKGSDVNLLTEMKFDQTLRICNAYPWSNADVEVLGKSIKYRQCEDLSEPIQKGQQLDFYSNKKQILLGSFQVQEVPENDALLLLVIQPHDKVSTGVKFSSHVYSNGKEPQIALLDASVGEPTEDRVKIADLESTDKATRMEELRFSSVVAVKPGSYELVLNEKTGRKYTLDAESGKKYSVVRIGVKADNPQKVEYPEDLIVFPSNSAERMMGLVGLVLSALVW